jgi:serine/threonine protein phosphatase PrpC
MRFELLDFLSLPGTPERPNEDSFVISKGVAAVFDGATGLGEPLLQGQSDAQWLAYLAARRLRVHAEEGAGQPRDWLRETAGDAQKSFINLRKRAPRENYEIPFASAVIVALNAHKLDVLWFGDCAALIKTPDGATIIAGDALAKRERERERVTRLARTRGAAPAGADMREEFLPALRAARNKVNTEHGDWLFAPDARCADHAEEATIAAGPGSLCLLASDGFLALISDYGAYAPDTLLAATERRGLPLLGEELRAIEADDPVGARFPRFKRSDDATALLLSLHA